MKLQVFTTPGPPRFSGGADARSREASKPSMCSVSTRFFFDSQVSGQKATVGLLAVCSSKRIEAQGQEGAPYEISPQPLDPASPAWAGPVPHALPPLIGVCIWQR